MPCTPHRRRDVGRHDGAEISGLTAHNHFTIWLTVLLKQKALKETTMIKLTAFRSLPPFAQGLARDFRVRWALEEARIPYEARLIGPEDQASAAYRALQPFGQVPAIEADGLTLFESGAIVLYIAEKSEALAPADAHGLARTKAWIFAALNSVEPAVMTLVGLDLFHAGEAWAAGSRPVAVQAVQKRLAALEQWL